MIDSKNVVWMVLSALLLTGSMAAGLMKETRAEDGAAAQQQAAAPRWQCAGFSCK